MDSRGCVHDLSDEDRNCCLFYGYLCSCSPRECPHYEDQEGKGWREGPDAKG